MGFPHVRGDNPRALASGLSYVQVDKHGVTILYHLISLDIANHKQNQQNSCKLNSICFKASVQILYIVM